MARRVICGVACVLFAVTAAGPGAPAQRRAKPARGAGRTKARPAPAKAERYACPMHPEVAGKEPGKCPKCGMALRPVKNAPAATKDTTATAAGGISGHAGAEAAAASAAATGPTEATPRQIPDVPVVDQDGRQLKFYTDLVKGKTVAVNFIFTTCTTICPPLTATFRRVQQTLGERAGRDFHLISVSVDPATDTPERLKDYAAKFKAGPGWTFVTGDKPDVDALLKSLGAFAPDRNDHTPTLIVVNDATGAWERTYGLAPPSKIVEVITGRPAGK